MICLNSAGSLTQPEVMIDFLSVFGLPPSLMPLRSGMPAQGQVAEHSQTALKTRQLWFYPRDRFKSRASAVPTSTLEGDLDPAPQSDQENPSVPDWHE